MPPSPSSWAAKVIYVIVISALLAANAVKTVVKGPFIYDVHTIFDFILPLPSLFAKSVLFVRKFEAFLDPLSFCVDVISE